MMQMRTTPFGVNRVLQDVPEAFDGIEARAIIGL
jgi:hypothetical protein